MSWFTDEAWHFYLPALLIAAIEFPRETDTLKEDILGHLAHSNKLALNMIARLSKSQIAALLAYFQAYEGIFPPSEWSYNEDDRESIQRVIKMLKS